MNDATALRPGWRLVPGWVRGRAGAGFMTRARRRQLYPVALLLLATAALYLWSLGASGWANSYYSAAVQAGASSWKAFLFGSFDASNFVTVDKPPASLWVMELSVRVFGLSSWSILVPQAVEGVAAVAVLYATVRRNFGHAAGLIAGAVLGLTPVATLIFRFNNPDALLVLLLVAAAYSVSRALDAGKTRWLVIAGVLVGIGFLTKMLQAFVVLPVFASVYLLAAPVPLRRRVWQLACAGLAVVLAAGWWVALVALWPAADRPYIGGSTDNSILNLIFGYNGFGRLSGNETGSVGGTGVPGGWGPTGWDRMFNSSYGGQISWLIPGALIAFGGLLALHGRAPLSDRKRAMTLLWGGWLLLTAAVFSFAQGIIHEYYSVALAPAIGALIGMGAVTAWRRRESTWVRALLAGAMLATSVWAFVLLGRTPAWLPWLAPGVLAAGTASAAAVLVLPRLRRPAALVVVATALCAMFAAPLAYSIDTAATPHNGALPLAGPALLADVRGAGRPGVPAGPGGAAALPGGFPPAGRPPFGGPLGAGPAGPPPGFGTAAAGAQAGALNGQPPGGAGGGLLNASRPSAAMVAALESNASNYRWVAATVGANEAAGYQLATGGAVMAIGGFNGTDPTPTLAQFQAFVSAKAIHFFIAGGMGGLGPGGSSSTSAIVAWVQQNFPATTIDAVTVYDLTAPKA